MKYAVIIIASTVFANIHVYGNMPNNPGKNTNSISVKSTYYPNTVSNAVQNTPELTKEKLTNSANKIGGENPVDNVSRGQIALGEVPDNTKVVVRIYSSGATFDDGSTTKTFTAKDFDANGTCRYKINKTLRNSTAMHVITIYQNNSVVRNVINWQ